MRDFKYTVTEKDYIEKLPIRELIKREFNFSSRLRTKIKKNKSVFLNDTSVPWWITPKPGDKLLILLPDETSYFEPANVPIIPLFEDNDLLIINKPAGYVVHPTNGYTENTIANGVAQYMIDTNQSFKIRFINGLQYRAAAYAGVATQFAWGAMTILMFSAAPFIRLMLIIFL